MYEFIDKTAEKSGTPINRKAMMAIQGFVDSKFTIYDDRIVEEFGDGSTLITTFDADGSITETYVGEKSISKKTVFGADGSIWEVVY
jgi:hypothetical protein